MRKCDNCLHRNIRNAHGEEVAYCRRCGGEEFREEKKPMGKEKISEQFDANFKVLKDEIRADERKKTLDGLAKCEEAAEALMRVPGGEDTEPMIDCEKEEGASRLSAAITAYKKKEVV